MSAKTVITCDHCGKEIPNNCDERFSHMGCNAAFAMGTIDACSHEHLGLALVKAFGLPIDTKAADLFVEHAKSEARRVFLETEVKRLEARIAELEAKPAGKTPECFLCGKGPHDHTMMVLESLPEQFEVKWCNGRRQNFGTEKPAWWDVPKSDHVHELKSCSFCDKQPPNTSAESGLPDAVLAAITLPTKPTKPLRERLEDLATYWYMGDKDDKELNGAYRLARQECAKELREVINDPR